NTRIPRLKVCDPAVDGGVATTGSSLGWASLLPRFPPSYTICSKVESRVHIANTAPRDLDAVVRGRESNNAVSPSRVRIARASQTARGGNRSRAPQRPPARSRCADRRVGARRHAARRSDVLLPQPDDTGH